MKMFSFTQNRDPVIQDDGPVLLLHGLHEAFAVDLHRPENLR